MAVTVLNVNIVGHTWMEWWFLGFRMHQKHSAGLSQTIWET